MTKLDISLEELNSLPRVYTTRNVGQFASGKSGMMSIAPMNAQINLRDHLPAPSLSQTMRFAAGAVNLPESWSWRADKIDPTVDTGDRLKIKQKITPILNQALCGSCWAFSTASAMSDVFTVSGKVIELGEGATSLATSAISPSSILSCLQGSNFSGCGGGNPAAAASTLQQTPVYGSNCMDYSWVLQNDSFNGSGTKHFTDEAELTKALNQALPPCGCLENAGNRHLFTVKDAHTLPAEGAQGTTSPESLENTWNVVRRWIFEKGPVVGAFVVYANFMGGDYSSTGGVYFEDGTYNGEGKTIMGCHAVRIVGWGVAKNVTKPDGSVGDVQYWEVANSWGDTWGDKGYFKIARYPDNQTSQFDALVEVQGSQIGGFVLFEAGDITLGNVPQVPPQYQNDYNPQRYKDGFYKTELSIQNIQSISDNGGGGSGGDSTGGDSKPFYKQPYFLIIAVLFFIAIAITAIIYFTKKRTLPSGAYTGYSQQVSTSKQPLVFVKPQPVVSNNLPAGNLAYRMKKKFY